MAQSTCEGIIALTCDVPVTCTVDSPTDSDLFSFSVAEGEIVHINVIEGSPSGTDFFATWRLLQADGTPAADCSFFTTVEESDCGPLPASGNPYRIEVEDNNHDDTGTYSVNVSPLTTGCCLHSVYSGTIVRVTTAAGNSPSTIYFRTSALSTVFFSGTTSDAKLINAALHALRKQTRVLLAGTVATCSTAGGDIGTINFLIVNP